MTRADLIRENEALHGLLAHACDALCQVGSWNCDLFPEDGWRLTALARDTLAQIKEGVVP